MVLPWIWATHSCGLVQEKFVIASLDIAVQVSLVVALKVIPSLSTTLLGLIVAGALQENSRWCRIDHADVDGTTICCKTVVDYLQSIGRIPERLLRGNHSVSRRGGYSRPRV